MTEETIYCQWIGTTAERIRFPEKYCGFYINYFHGKCERCSPSPRLNFGWTPEQLLDSLKKTGEL